jgi:hypothetical protein
MKFIKAIITGVFLVLPVSGILAIFGCAGHNKLSPPKNLVRAGQDSGTGQVKLVWENVPGSVSYNLYVSKTSGAKKSGKKFINVANPVTITNLEVSTTYFFVLTSVRYGTESEPSEEISYLVVE